MRINPLLEMLPEEAFQRGPDKQIKVYKKGGSTNIPEPDPRIAEAQMMLADLSEKQFEQFETEIWPTVQNQINTQLELASEAQGKQFEIADRQTALAEKTQGQLYDIADRTTALGERSFEHYVDESERQYELAREAQDKMYGIADRQTALGEQALNESMTLARNQQKLAEEAQRKQFDIADKEMARSDEIYNRMKDTFYPLQNKMVDKAMEFNSEGYHQQMAARAIGDVEAQNEIARRNSQMQMAKFGVDPTSGASQGTNRAMNVMGAANKAAAGNRAYMAAKELGWNLGMQASGLGSGLPAYQAGASGLALQGNSAGVATGLGPASLLGNLGGVGLGTANLYGGGTVVGAQGLSGLGSAAGMGLGGAGLYGAGFSMGNSTSGLYGNAMATGNAGMGMLSQGSGILNQNYGTAMQGWGQVGNLGVNKYNADINAWSAQQAAAAQEAAGWGQAIGALGGAAISRYSDVRLKQNIKHIGNLKSGTKIYEFEFKPEFTDQLGHGKQIGVMAQEIIHTNPEAVSLNDDGYYMVDYSKVK